MECDGPAAPSAGRDPGGGEASGRGRVLVVAGTHGNEINAPWLIEHALAAAQPAGSAGPAGGGGMALEGLLLETVIGNPAARAAGRRYLERDLNRSFVPSLLAASGPVPLEVERARQLLHSHGPQGQQPCLVALDLHSTTAAMGNSLVVYGRRPVDLALAAALQRQLGLPVYLHEADARQTGFLVERWPCGLVIEVGPVPQGVLQPAIVQQTRLALEETLALLAQAADGQLQLPSQLVVHRHLGSLDLPRRADGAVAALIHPRRQGRDWQPLHPGDPLFLTPAGETVPYAAPEGLEGRPVWPVFINEAAYGEKGIALSLTERELWPVPASWREALLALAARLERSAAVGLRADGADGGAGC
ncbi:MAG: aspartoacylase [Cyanobium sp.]